MRSPNASPRSNRRGRKTRRDPGRAQPGRVSSIGEHTDYNDGFVLPIAIDRAITVALVPTDDRVVSLTLTETGETAGVDLDAIGPRRGEWIDYVAGTGLGHGRCGAADARLPRAPRVRSAQGAGLSSSAALELVSTLALTGGEEPPMDRSEPRADRPAGREHVRRRALRPHGPVRLIARRGRGRATAGLSVAGLPDGAASSRPRRARRQRSGSPRRLDASAYNERRAQCEAAAAAIGRSFPEVRSLRDVTPAMLDGPGAKLDALLERRARHVVDENVG